MLGLVTRILAAHADAFVYAGASDPTAPRADGARQGTSRSRVPRTRRHHHCPAAPPAALEEHFYVHIAVLYVRPELTSRVPCKSPPLIASELRI
ncbi:hypothetical protein HYPSUDRAFT_202260 [Hypholoma sublateritium FD-334 SS-4]|uniref:Uncharacterized protein n=1 Tax=Hypholoma sublateritium (strain FD-334 SS-4) TaxID=945553 RepID=A0A0D2P0K8_HYPSF|nr:hypothetical protein HYPSUDRAFT_202260 [Hypholoma sublateritium FD-334 SS-4]